MNVSDAFNIKVNTITNSKIDLYGYQNINNFELKENHTILVKNQENFQDNGIYTIRKDKWVMCLNTKHKSLLFKPVAIYVLNGNYKNTLWIMTHNKFIKFIQNN